MTVASWMFHLHQGLLHVLHRARLRAQDRRALTHERAQGAHCIARPEGTAQQAIAHQLLQPLAIEHVGLAPRDVLHMPRVDQQHREAARVAQLEQRDPVHAGGFHRDGVDAALGEPVGQALQLSGEAAELAHRLVIAIGRHGHEVAGAADVDAGRVGVGQGQRRGPGGTAIALRHGVLHHEVVERDAEVGTSS